MVYRVTCSFRVFLDGNYIYSWKKSSCSCFDSPACVQFSCQLSRLVWTSSPALLITLEIPVQLQTFLNKNCSICVLPFYFMETLYFLVCEAVWVWKINQLISYFTNLSLKYIDYFLFYFFIPVWAASALLENRANTLTRIHPAGKKKLSCLIYCYSIYNQTIPLP